MMFIKIQSGMKITEFMCKFSHTVGITKTECLNQLSRPGVSITQVSLSSQEQPARVKQHQAYHAPSQFLASLFLCLPIEFIFHFLLICL